MSRTCLSTLIRAATSNVEAVTANKEALLHYGQRVVYGHVTTNSGKRVLMQITFDVMSVRKPLVSTSALKCRCVTIIFNHDYDRIIVRNETANVISHDCHSYLCLTLAKGIPHRKSMADADQAGQLHISGETRAARALRTPETPTEAARMIHNTTHIPFRDWCPFCVASRGRSSPHRRVVVNKTADKLPKFQVDYMFIQTVAESKTQPCITFVETRSGVVISFMCARKG